MFPTSAVRSANYRINENSDNLLQVKKGGILGSARKPLGDKAVNEISPQRTVEKPQKTKECNAVEIKIVSPAVSPKLSDNALWEDICSYKDVEDDMEDILSYSQCLGVSGIVNILESYARRCSTPTPKPMVIETPGACFDRFDFLTTDDDVSVYEEFVGDVSLPALDLDILSF